tara:strand:- start:24384 stop:25226 length:843 start_codon:yes stop_codon:yes gene_type:complete
MPTIINQDSVDFKILSNTSKHQTLLDEETTGSDHVVVERLILEKSGKEKIIVGSEDLTGMQVLRGEGILSSNSISEQGIDDSHVLFFPPGFEGEIFSENGLDILCFKVPKIKRFDENISEKELQFKCVNWKEEPVLNSEHDARKRVYLVTPSLFGTKAIKGEMIIYPPGTVASNHHHEGTEHFMYVIQGEGTQYSNEEPHNVRAGDIIYHFDKERHYLENTGKEDFIFSEFFIPAEYNTVWTNEALICAWLPTGENIEGGKPSREIKAHSSAHVENPSDI